MNTPTTDKTSPRIGVLAIQGDYEAHASALEEAGARPALVKTAEALYGLDGLVMPGGESTTMLRFLERGQFFERLQEFARQKPVFGTCAGAILLAKDVRNPTHPGQAQRSLGILDMAVERNAYGAQRDSAILTLETMLPEWRALGPLETVFIRAPRIVAVGANGEPDAGPGAGPRVEVLVEREGFPVLVRQGRTMAATFHPELSADRRVHRLFVELVRRDEGAAVQK